MGKVRVGVTCFGSSFHLISCEKTSLLEMSDAEVISSCEASGDWQIALALLHQMIAISLRQDAYSYSAVMNTVARFFFVSKNWSWGVIRSWWLKELTSGFHQLGEAKSVNCCVLVWDAPPPRTNEHVEVIRFFIVIPINLYLPLLLRRGASQVPIFYLDF